MLQEILNPASPEKKQLQFGAIVFRMYDRVVQLVNDYTKGIFNGEIGTIIDIDVANHTLRIRYRVATLRTPSTYHNESENTEDFVELTYTGEELNDVSLAWALTVHKSQGSEYPVVMFFLGNSSWLLQRPLIYTAFTRARSFLAVWGKKRHLFLGIQKKESHARFTALAKRINTKLSAFKLTSQVGPLAENSEVLQSEDEQSAYADEAENNQQTKQNESINIDDDSEDLSTDDYEINATMEDPRPKSDEMEWKPIDELQIETHLPQIQSTLSVNMSSDREQTNSSRYRKLKR
jgi:hypothetical protein